MFENIVLHLFHAVVRTSVGMIPFLAMILLLDNQFRKQYSTAWKYSLFLLILVRLLIPAYIGKNENLIWNNILTKIEIAQTTNKTPIKYDNEKNNLELSKTDNILKKTTVPETKTIKIHNVPEIKIPQIQKMQYSLPSTKNNIALFTIFAYIWFIVVTIKLLYLFVQYMLFYKKITRWRTTNLQKNTLEIYYNVCNAMEIKKIPKLFVCEAITSPMCFGLFQKGIYITKQEIPTQEMEMILKHELCHYKRKDLNYQLLCVLVSVIHFFNPFVTAFVKIAERDIELSCDDVVMKDCQKDKRKQYSIMILSMIKESEQNRLSNYFVKEKNIMKKRFENILDNSPKKKGSLLFILLWILFILSYSFSIFAEKQQLTLLFYSFNLFVFFSFCFVMSTKQYRKKTLCAMIVLCLSVNTLLVGCSQNMQNTSNVSEQLQSDKIEHSDEEIESLLKWKTDYVGDNSAVGNILSALGAPVGMVSNGFEIQSSEEPYGIKIYYTIEDFYKTQPYNGSGHGFNGSEIIVNDDVEFHFRKSYMVLFSLIKNLGYVEYHISHEDREKMTFCITRENVIDYDKAVGLKEGMLEGYTNSIEDYRYFLEYVDDMKTQTHFGYEQWQKEIDDALDEIIYNEKVAMNSDVDSYIQNAPNNSYYAIVQKGEQALYYFLERFEEGTAKGLRGQIMVRICQEILGEKIEEMPVITPSAEEWYEQYQLKYNGVYPLYSSITENKPDSEFLIPRHIQEIFIAIEKAYGGGNIKILSSLLLYTSPNGIQHQYENALKINYYAKIKCYNFKILEQSKGNVLCLVDSNILPVKIAFEQTEDNVLLKEVKLQFDETLEAFCEEDEQMLPLLSSENKDGYSTVFDGNLEQNLKDYVSQNDMDVPYYCIDGKTIKTF